MARDHPWGDILKIQNSFYLSIVKEGDHVSLHNYFV